jgi:hypothetical protein
MNVIKHYENVALSNMDLIKMLDGKAKVVIYPDLIKYKNIDQVLGKYGACFLLFEAKPKYGHWCCLFKTDENKIEFFNPYGGYPDDSLDFIPMHFRQMTDQLYPILSLLLLGSKYKLEYNQYPFQMKAKDVKTCGRHCVCRLLCRHLSLNEYKRFLDFMSSKLHLNYDGIVALITSQ